MTPEKIDLAEFCRARASRFGNEFAAFLNVASSDTATTESLSQMTSIEVEQLFAIHLADALSFTLDQAARANFEHSRSIVTRLERMNNGVRKVAEGERPYRIGKSVCFPQSFLSLRGLPKLARAIFRIKEIPNA